MNICRSPHSPPDTPQKSSLNRLNQRTESVRHHSNNPLLNIPIASRLAIGFLIPALIAAIALGSIGIQSVQILSQESTFYQGLMQTYTSLNSAQNTLQQMQTTMQGTINDATQSQPSPETLHEDYNAIHTFETNYDGLMNTDVQHNTLDQDGPIAALFIEAGHSNQIAEQRKLVNNALSSWHIYRDTQNQVLQELQQKDFKSAQDLEDNQVNLYLATTTTDVLKLTKFDGSLAHSIHDATVVEENKQLLVTILAVCSVLLGIGIVGWLVSNTLIQRLKRLREVVQSIEHGQLDARLAVVGRDEIADVSSSVNAMLDTIINAHELEKLHQELQVQHEMLNEANARLEALATTDALTELPNHRSLISTLEQELVRAQSYQRTCSILFMDIDHFKALNDGYGHAAGDAVLKEFARLLQTNIRPIDIVGRWGGEEFIAILPEMAEKEALHFAEQIRAKVAAETFSVGGGMSLSCSIGLACYPLHGKGREEIVTAADQAMYGAKRLGRNQVRTAHDPLVQAILLENAQDGGREEATLMGIVEALIRMAEVHDPSTSFHVQEINNVLLDLTGELGLPSSEAQMIVLACRLHDIGKISIPDSILKKPGKLTEEEWILMRTHSVVGAEIVTNVPMLRPLAPLIRSHHERWDGTGYPDQLAGEAIPLGARIIAVVDAYMAMRTNRPYQKACSHEEALAELKRCAGTQFDPHIIALVDNILLQNKQRVEFAGTK